jgi:hypothetical protein
MARGTGRKAKTFRSSKGEPRLRGSDKDQRRSAVHGRAEQGMGTAGRAGGTKSSGGHAGHGAERGMPKGGNRGRRGSGPAR